ncbi:MAG: cytochrome c3 family protein [Syntrophobacteria bacterium]
MEKSRSLSVWAGVAVTFVIFLIFCMTALGIEAPLDRSDQIQSDPARADIIAFDTLTVFDDLERPKVVFLHDLHTDALEKKNKDCTTCHLSENDRLSPRFKRLKDAGKQEMMDIYHTNCVDCHKVISAAGEKAGPVVCGECHRKKPTILSSRVPMGFDKSLHYRHSRALKKQCERCHHEYDQKSKKLFYAKYKEGTCRYCHKKETEELISERRISMRLASHLSCIDCHRKTRAKNMTAGPVRCSGCHNLEQQQQIEKIDPVPRMRMKQPDFVLIKAGGKESSVARMNRVPFSHKAHEGYSDTCRVCHHKDLKSCLDCHTLTGSKEGKDVKLLQAMHQLDSEKSCLGCHKTIQRDQRCVGCHGFISDRRKQGESYCLKCHMAPLQERTGVLTQTGERELARMVPEIWRAIFGARQVADIPEKVIIKTLEERYEPVEFPHRKVFRALVKKIEGDKLAAYFHLQEGTLCQRCHHNSPAAKKPPRCGTCHGKPFDEKNLFQPGLKGAYHRQCIGCHDKMGIEKPVSVDCTGCHREKKQ